MSTEIQEAFKVIEQALIKDPDYKRSWCDNIAMVIHDCLIEEIGLKLVSKDLRDKIAERILNHFFRYV